MSNFQVSGSAPSPFTMSYLDCPGQMTASSAIRVAGDRDIYDVRICNTNDRRLPAEGSKRIANPVIAMFLNWEHCFGDLRFGDAGFGEQESDA